MNRRFFGIAGITICVESELEFDSSSFGKEFESFTVDGPGDDNVKIRHIFDLPDPGDIHPGVEVYRKPPWAISRDAERGMWIYRGISPTPGDLRLHRVAVFSDDHTQAVIYSPKREAEFIRETGWPSLSLLPTDQIWLAPLLADRNAVLLHSAAVILNGKGLLFVGHSGAGKSTITNMLKNFLNPDLKGLQDLSGPDCHECEILCDDRNIARRMDDGWRVYGSWSHGDVPEVSGNDAPLRAVCFIEKSDENRLAPLVDRKEIMRRLLACLIRPLVTANWWNQTLDLVERMSGEVPCYVMRFDRSGEIVNNLITQCANQLIDQR